MLYKIFVQFIKFLLKYTLTTSIKTKINKFFK
nr:MAG TPA: hypothetical protein [Caudoviricetes sp.]DAQ86531.1 MAG TPA: hypothetical protein [Caudoviricetes sp.]